jgi:predicted transposase YdaD
LASQFDKWCFFLKNLPTFDVIPQVLNEPIFMKAFETTKISNLSPDDYVLFRISESKKYDMEILEEEAEQRGLERGLKRGLERGARNERVKVVMNLHRKNYPVDAISDILDIPSEEVEAIISMGEAGELENDIETNIDDVIAENDLSLD